VTDNIRYFAGLYEQNNAKRDEMVREAIAFVGLEKYAKFAAKKLSGGLKRRLNIACGIAHRPEFIMFDEPTVAVDAQSRNFILEGIKEMNRNGSTILYTTHYLEEAQELCDRIVIMDEGRNMASGTLEELIDLVDPTEAVHLFLIDPSDAALKMIAEIPGVVDVSEENGKTVIMLTPPGQHLSTLLEELKRHEIYYTSLYSELPTLNDVFLKLTGKALRD
jgi:ABC-2 type transport system ATP-binding protein